MERARRSLQPDQSLYPEPPAKSERRPDAGLGVVVPEEGGRIYKTMRWGLVPMWAKGLKIGNVLSLGYPVRSP
jgi:hypothetical protein